MKKCWLNDGKIPKGKRGVESFKETLGNVLAHTPKTILEWRKGMRYGRMDKTERKERKTKDLKN